MTPFSKTIVTVAHAAALCWYLICAVFGRATHLQHKARGTPVEKLRTHHDPPRELFWLLEPNLPPVFNHHQAEALNFYQHYDFSITGNVLQLGAGHRPCFHEYHDFLFLAPRLVFIVCSWGMAFASGRAPDFQRSFRASAAAYFK